MPLSFYLSIELNLLFYQYQQLFLHFIISMSAYELQNGHCDYGGCDKQEIVLITFTLSSCPQILILTYNETRRYLLCRIHLFDADSMRMNAE